MSKSQGDRCKKKHFIISSGVLIYRWGIAAPRISPAVIVVEAQRALKILFFPCQIDLFESNRIFSAANGLRNVAVMFFFCQTDIY